MMERSTSLAARVPARLLPSAGGGSGAASSSYDSSTLGSSDSMGSLDSELQGLQMAPVSHKKYGRSACTPHRGQPPAAAARGKPGSSSSSSSSSSSGGRCLATTIALQADTAGQQSAPAEAHPAAPVQRVGSRRPSQAGSAGAAPAAPLSSSAGGACTTHSRSASLDSYADEGFEAEEWDAKEQASDEKEMKGSQRATGSSSAAGAAAASQGKGGSARHGASRHGASSPPSTSSTTKPPCRTTFRLGYLSSTAATEGKRSGGGGGGQASAPSSRPGSASPATKHQQLVAR